MQATTEKLYDMIDDIGTAMLTTERAGMIRSRPMRGKLYRESGEIWFLTKAGEGKADEISDENNSALIYACPEKETYVSVTGRAYMRRNQAKIDDLWGPWAEA
ncbi:pyridoxamine 5'-phosphate oxidase family protein [Sphingorhabdus arenilitoris]|uniref:Pyridoxamine 5'-phosphate oxidase family protein n=1 Tax=Sphingorhabdus arenilitoris TaxID=1490041 RepID=A0ABV8RDG1_9SPHN